MENCYNRRLIEMTGVQDMIRFGSLLGVTLLASLTAVPAYAKDKIAPPASVVASGKAKSWTEGHKMAAKGASMVADGDKDLAKAAEQRAKNEARITDGKARTAAAEDAYRKYLAALTPAEDPKAAKAQVKSLDDLVGRWSKAAEQVREGEKGVREAENRKADGERKKTTGARMIAEGNALKSAAEGLVPAAAAVPGGR